jgi:3-hydroxyisobutyrate dehydrogenase-like beta-hydroxyacid dehydrogenase
MAEITLLAEAAGVARSDFLEFLNDSVMGSTFTRYKTPSFVNLDYRPTFTLHLLRKDFELGLETGRLLDVPLPTAALVHQLVMDGIGRGYGDQDFASMLSRHAEGTNVVLEPEQKDVSDGLSGSM